MEQFHFTFESPFCAITANTRSSLNVGLMMAHRLRLWPSIKPALGERLVFTRITLIRNISHLVFLRNLIFLLLVFLCIKHVDHGRMEL